MMSAMSLRFEADIYCLYNRVMVLRERRVFYYNY